MTTSKSQPALLGKHYAAAPAAAGVGIQGERISTARVIVDSGFRPEKDGFGFENYGPAPNGNDLGPTEVEQLFGDGPAVCSAHQAGKCKLTPGAEWWMEEENRAMAGGHCFGFSVTSLMFFQGLLNQHDFAGTAGAERLTTPLLRINDVLEHRIAEEWALQNSARVIDAEIRTTPNQILDKLIAALGSPKLETYTLVMFSRAGAGHAVTPFAVEDRGAGQTAVLIYDNNFPNKIRSVTFDRKADGWRYEGGVDPKDKSDLYDGDAKTRSAYLVPTSVAVGPQPWPPTGIFYEISLAGDSLNHGHVLLTDSTGRRTGYVGRQLVNEIPGARVIQRVLSQNWAEASEPRYLLPPDAHVSISLDGTALRQPDTESVTVFGSGYNAVASSIVLRPGEQDEINVKGRGTALSYRPERGFTQAPHIEVGLDRPARDYRFSVDAPSIPGGSELSVVAQPTLGRLKVDAGAVASAGAYALAVTQVPRSGHEVVSNRSVRVPAGGSAQLRFGKK